MREFLLTISNSLSKVSRDQKARERFFLIVLITLLVAIWFRKGLILGSGESGLPFYNTVHLVELLKSNWTDVPLGSGGSIGFPSYPLYATVSFFQQLHVPSFILQAAMFWIIFIVGTLAVFEIACMIEGNSPISRLSSSLFYIFNPIVHISVLHRFQYPEIFFYGFMPLALCVYFKGLRSKNFTYLVVLALVGLVFSFTFVGPAFLELLFAVLAFLSFFIFLSTFKEKRDYFPFFYFLTFVVIFLLLNIWWIAPLFGSVLVDLGKRGSVKYFSSSDNIDTFKGISLQVQSVLNVFRLYKPNAYLPEESSWAWVYYTFPFVILSFFSIIAFVIGLFKKGKSLLYKFLILLALITMFWMKGTLPPFGGVTLFIFQSFTFLQVFRNPFEKIGMLLPLVMAIPIGFGIVMISNALAKRLKLAKSLVSCIILVLVFPIYMFPIVNGLAFTGGPPPANNPDIGQYIKVPDYYQEAREWLDRQPGPFRVLVLPIDGEGMTHKWEYGYSGVELSNNLFNQPMVSLETSQGNLPTVVNGIKYILLNNSEKLGSLLQLLNIKYIMVRDDIDYKVREIESPIVDTKIILDKMQKFVTPVAEFGKLKLFKLNQELFYPRIFASHSQTYLYTPLGNNLNLLSFASPSPHDIFITSEQVLKDNPDINSVRNFVLGGQVVENLEEHFKDPIENLPFVSVYRDTPFYALVRLKEEVENQLLNPDDQLRYKVNLMGKRLAELNHSPDTPAALGEYISNVKQVDAELLASTQIDKVVIEKLITQRDALEEIKKKVADKNKGTIDQVIAELNDLFQTVGAKSIYPTDKQIIRRFYIPRDSTYELLVSKQDWNLYYTDEGISEFDLDGKTIKLSVIKTDARAESFSLGAYPLKQGLHEVGIAYPRTKNLITEQLPEELTLSSQDRQPITRTIPIAELSNKFNYNLSFEYLEEKGNIPVVALHSDADFVAKDGKKIPRLAIALSRDNYNFGWKKYSGSFAPFSDATNYYISFKVLPFGDCKAVVQRPYRRYCEDNAFNQRMLRDSSYKIRNLRVEKVFKTDSIAIRSLDNIPSADVTAQVDFEQISPARYKVKISNAQQPFFLVLSTTFDPRWKAYFTSNRPSSIGEMLSESLPGDQIADRDHFEVNGYANAWHINKLGSYELFLEYSPEQGFIIGQKLALLVIGIAVIYTGMAMYRALKRRSNNARYAN